MTFKEHFFKLHPNARKDVAGNPRGTCVSFVGYEDIHPCKSNCSECWNREMPEDIHEQLVDLVKQEIDKFASIYNTVRDDNRIQEFAGLSSERRLMITREIYKELNRK